MIDIQLFPRYQAYQLKTQINATLVGKLVQNNKKKSSLTLETDPQAKINIDVILPEHEQLSNFAVGKYYEVRGVCRSNKEVELKGYTCFGSNFDLSSYNVMLQLASKEFRSIFYP